MNRVPSRKEKEDGFLSVGTGADLRGRGEGGRKSSATCRTRRTKRPKLFPLFPLLPLIPLFRKGVLNPVYPRKFSPAPVSWWWGLLPFLPPPFLRLSAFLVCPSFFFLRCFFSQSLGEGEGESVRQLGSSVTKINYSRSVAASAFFCPSAPE